MGGRRGGSGCGALGGSGARLGPGCGGGLYGNKWLTTFWVTFF